MNFMVGLTGKQDQTDGGYSNSPRTGELVKLRGEAGLPNIV
jgi:hypothetical protein